MNVIKIIIFAHLCIVHIIDVRTNFSTMIAICQGISCQLVNYQTFKMSDRFTDQLFKPFEPSVEKFSLEKLFNSLKLMCFTFCYGIATWSTYAIYGFDWLRMVYKFLICYCYAILVHSLATLLIANSLFIGITSSAICGTIGHLKANLLAICQPMKRRQIN